MIEESEHVWEMVPVCKILWSEIEWGCRKIRGIRWTFAPVFNGGGIERDGRNRTGRVPSN